MKKRFMILACLLSSFACTKEDVYDFKDVGRIQFYSSSVERVDDFAYSFVWLNQKRSSDTIYLPLSVLGGASNLKRYVNIVQVPEYDVEYKYDNKGYVIDSTIIEVPNQAVPGKHYVPFNQEDLQALLYVDAGCIRDSIPVVLLRDASLKQAGVRLRIRLNASDDFQLGEERFLTRTVIFSDKLEKPGTWDFMTDRSLGNYSIAKHQLMIDVVGERVDDAWIQKGNKDVSFFVFWRGKFIEALEKFNSNPENLASGKAPLREDPTNQNSPLVKFPTRI